MFVYLWCTKPFNHLHMKYDMLFKILRYLAIFLAGGLSALGISSCSSLLVNTGTQVPSVNMPTITTPNVDCSPVPVLPIDSLLSFD